MTLNPFKWFKGSPWPDRGRTVTRAEFFKIISDNVGPGVRIKLRDGEKFRLLSAGYWEALIFRVRQQDPSYASDVFDCDNFGDGFMADVGRGWAFLGGREPLGFGWIHIKVNGADSQHWLNFIVDDEDTMLLWEPQTDKVVYPDLEAIFEVTQ